MSPPRPWPRTMRPTLALAAAGLMGLVLFAATGTTPADPTVKLVFVGDVMLDTLPGEAIARGQDPFADFAAVFRDADLAVANLECVVASVGERDRQRWTFRAHPRVLPVLKRHFGAVSLANNHTGDFGPSAFLQQLDLLREHKLPYFGGGKNITEARTPLVVDRHGLRIALLGYNDYYHPRRYEAGPHWPGVAWAVDEQMAADVQAARTLHKADLVIPFLHWGWEEYPPDDRQKELARLLIDRGADVVVGGHPHVTQGAEYYKGKLIVYSLGNFVFDGFKTDDTRTGWVLRLTLGRAGLRSWDTLVARLDDQGVPHLAPDVPSPSGHAASPVIRNQPQGKGRE